MADFSPAAPELALWLEALERQNRARRRALLEFVGAEATMKFVASLRDVLPAQDDEVALLLADLAEMEAEALRRGAIARGKFRWATARTRRTLGALGRRS